jgi:hypothetical protein
MAISKDKRRQTSNEKYVDALQDRYSKLCVVRVDFGYKKDENNEVNVTLEEANKHIERLLVNRRNNSIFNDNVGYIIKTEYTEDRGVHNHVALFYDGNKVQNDKYKGDQIGNYWETITKGNGSYHNCNRNDYKNNATGMIDYRDVEKRRNLDKAMEYLAKDEQNIDGLNENGKSRAIRRGTVPKSKGNKGRPRNQ